MPCCAVWFEWPWVRGHGSGATGHGSWVMGHGSRASGIICDHDDRANLRGTPAHFVWVTSRGNSYGLWLMKETVRVAVKRLESHVQRMSASSILKYLLHHCMLSLIPDP